MRDAIIKKIDLHKLSDEKLLELYELMLEQPRKMSSCDEYIIKPLINADDNELKTNIQDWIKSEQIEDIKKEIKPSGIIYHIDLMNSRQSVLRFSEDVLSKEGALSLYNSAEDGYLINREQLDIIEKNINIIQTSKYPFELDTPYWMVPFYDAQSNSLFEQFKVVRKYNEMGYYIKLVPITPHMYSAANSIPCKCAYVEHVPLLGWFNRNIMV